MTDNKPTFAHRLRQARERAGLTQDELTSLCRFSSDIHVYRLERGWGGTSFEYAIRLADALNVSLDYLAGRTEEESVVSAVDTPATIATTQPAKVDFKGDVLDPKVTQAELLKLIEECARSGRRLDEILADVPETKNAPPVVILPGPDLSKIPATLKVSEGQPRAHIDPELRQKFREAVAKAIAATRDESET